MFSKSRQLLLSSFTRKFLDTKGRTVKCLNLTPFSTAAKFGNKNEPNHDYRKELNIYRTFTAKLRPDLVEESEKFNALYPEIKGEITSYVEKVTNKRAAEHVNKVFDYNVPGGKQFRVMQIIMGYKHLMDKSEQTPEKMRQVYIIGWALELVTSIIVIHDDMIDGGLIRRGAPCWHTLEDIGSFAVVDYIQVIHSAYFLLKNHCRELPAYPRLFESIVQGVHSAMLGQTMDHFSPSVAEFHQSATDIMVADFFFYTPLSMVMALTGHSLTSNCTSIRSICNELGHYIQCQNDFLDVFNIDGMLQKTVHDIEIGKCSWLSSACMERANDAQKRIMIDNYGKKDPECIERVKQLYLDMNMQQVYEEVAYQKYDTIEVMIQKASCDGPIKELLYQILDLTFHRSTIKSN